MVRGANAMIWPFTINIDSKGKSGNPRSQAAEEEKATAGGLPNILNQANRGFEEPHRSGRAYYRRAKPLDIDAGKEKALLRVW